MWGWFPVPLLLCSATLEKFHYITLLNSSFFLCGIKFQKLHLLANLLKKSVISYLIFSTLLSICLSLHQVNFLKAPLLLYDIHTELLILFLIHFELYFIFHFVLNNDQPGIQVILSSDTHFIYSNWSPSAMRQASFLFLLQIILLPTCIVPGLPNHLSSVQSPKTWLFYPNSVFKGVTHILALIPADFSNICHRLLQVSFPQL